MLPRSLHSAARRAKNRREGKIGPLRSGRHSVIIRTTQEHSQEWLCHEEEPRKRRRKAALHGAEKTMDFGLSDHQRLIRETVRSFMEVEVRPHVKEWERTEEFPLEAIEKLALLGCCGMLVPEEWGGTGLDTISYVLMLEEVARVHAAMSTAIAVTNSAVQLPLLAFGNVEQKNRYLKLLAAGEFWGRFA